MFRSVIPIAGVILLAAPFAHSQSLSDRIDRLRHNHTAEQTRNESRAQMLGALVYRDLTVTFDGTSARDAIRHVARMTDVTLLGRYHDDRTSIGIDPDQPITLAADGTPALRVLEMILEQCSDDLGDCTWQLRDSFVEVGTKERLGAKSAQELRYYPVHDLLFEPTQFNNAPDIDLDAAMNQANRGGNQGGFGGPGGGGRGGSSGGAFIGTPGEDPEQESEQERGDRLAAIIRELVEPAAWVHSGGSWANIRYHQGVLIVRAPDFIQRQIGGYPFAVRSPGADSIVGSREQSAPSGPRYVTFAASGSTIEFEIEERSSVYAVPDESN